MSRHHPIPIVAIVGRPNVGKSRLFNRYAGTARALVEDRPGITRDRIAEQIEVEGRPVLIVDTAGLDAARGLEELENAVQAQAREAVAEADAILFVVDGKAGLLPEDETIARTLRRSAKPVALAVNKIDRPGHMDRLNDFYALGLGDITAVSAEHGAGCFDALEELVRALPEEKAEPAASGDAPTRVAIVGRPNAGKSSLVNQLLGAERVVVSSVPGTTRDAIDVELSFDEPDGTAGRVLLVDTAGLRRPGRRTGVAERGSALMTVRALERADVAILVVDAAEGMTDQDAHVAGLVQDRGRPCVVAANKWDQVASEDRARTLEQIEHGLRFLDDAPIQTISAKTGSRVRRLLPLVRKVGRASQRRISTSELNQWLDESTRLHSPSMAQKGPRRRPMKFFYATQVAVAPPTFLLFCTDPDGVQASYRRFLENRLRECFDFEGTPIRLVLRARRETSE